MTGSANAHRFGLGWALGVRLLAAMAALCPLPLFAGDRSVTMFEGVPEPVPPAPPGLGAAGTGPLADLKTDNPAGLKVEILPSGTLHLGAKIAFKVSTTRPGYLVLVDINAEGKLMQIYPNVMSLSRSSGNVAEANLIKPDVPVTIPNPKNPLARFVFTADLPRGGGAIVAILSEAPVQIIDLPEMPAETQGTQATVDQLCQSVLALKIASSDQSGKFVTGTWSFAAMPYVIE